MKRPISKNFPVWLWLIDALRQGGTMPAVLNAANEITVQAFLDGKIRLSEIAEINRNVMNKHQKTEAKDLETILETDRLAREQANEFLRGKEAAR